MLLRNIVILLLIANLGYFTYSKGWLSAVIGADAGQREPERVIRQVNPEAISVILVLKTEAPILEEPISTAQKPTPPMTQQTELVSTCTSKREQWVIYMGPYANKALAERKKTELSRLGVDSSSIAKPTLKIGLSLGQFDSENAAREALTTLSTQGVKTAAVVLWNATDCPSS